LTTKDTKEHEVENEGKRRDRSNLGPKSEVAVKRFEGHHGTGTFRPKVKGWTEGTEWEFA
jgi:hypothetical protein